MANRGDAGDVPACATYISLMDTETQTNRRVAHRAVEFAKRRPLATLAIGAGVALLGGAEWAVPALLGGAAAALLARKPGAALRQELREKGQELWNEARRRMRRGPTDGAEPPMSS